LFSDISEKKTKATCTGDVPNIPLVIYSVPILGERDHSYLVT